MIVVKSFKICGINIAINGQEDQFINPKIKMQDCVEKTVDEMLTSEIYDDTEYADYLEDQHLLVEG